MVANTGHPSKERVSCHFRERLWTGGNPPGTHTFSGSFGLFWANRAGQDQGKEEMAVVLLGMTYSNVE
jgi:hypothetical protein